MLRHDARPKGASGFGSHIQTSSRKQAFVSCSVSCSISIGHLGPLGPPGAQGTPGRPEHSPDWLFRTEIFEMNRVLVLEQTSLERKEYFK